MNLKNVISVGFVFSINVKIKPGSFVGIVGQVGCGKSTLLSAMLGETDKLGGRVSVQVNTFLWLSLFFTYYLCRNTCVDEEDHSGYRT
jgi:ABC-type lipoprotein export system ATPase subunit